MSEQASSQDASAKAQAGDRRVKLIFLAVAVAAALVVYLVLQRDPPLLRDWPGNLDEALRQAAKENRRVLAFFVSSPLSEDAKWIASTTLKKGHNRRAIADGKFVRVKVRLKTSLDSKTARAYRIRRLPTMLILSPDGTELNRREGRIGEVPFREGFLDGTDVFRPAGPARP